MDPYHPRLLKCMIITLNYNMYLTLYPNNKWAVNFDGKACHVQLIRTLRT